MVRSVPSTWYGCRSTRSLRIWKNNKKEAVKKERGFLPVEIPHDWQIYDASFFYEDCSGWYRKKVICKKEKNLRYLLRFEGIYMDSELYVNSRKVLEWKYGYSTFEADITDFLENGNNEIMVGVHVKHPNSRWYAGAGIYRNVWLKTVHTEHLVSDGIYVSTEEQKDGYQVLVYVETSQAAGTEVQCNLEGIEKKLPIRRDGDRAEFSFFLKNPKLWEPETPNLYMITVRLYKKGKLLEEEHVNFGCRTIETDPQQGFLLNHKKRKLKGVCLHHNLGALGSAVKKDAIKRQLTLMKEMGADAIRTAHNMPAVELMELADEMGFLIVSEAFDCWERPKNPYDYARFFTDWWKRDIASWVRRDRNHPSLIFWSIGNEIYDMHADERGQTFTRLLMEEVYRHDFKRNGRVTFGSNFMPWEKAQKCADIVKIAGYNYYYNYKNHTAELTERVLRGEPLDPLLYISSSLFILGAGLFVLRIVPLLVKGIFMIGKKRWKPASYVSFMEIMKNGRKQQFIMLFLILTLSMGMFHATVARTISQNARENRNYLDGADLVLEEVWDTNASFASVTGEQTELQYYEPDYGRYASITEAESYTKVIYDEKAFVKTEDNIWQSIALMGIHTKEFGENTELSDTLLAEPYHQLLNKLAVEPEGILVSDSFRTELGMKEGDTLYFKNGDEKEAKGKIVGFVSYWPGFQTKTIELNEAGELREKDNYLIVADYAALRQYFGVTPYQVWITVKEGESTDFFYQWMEENEVSVKSYTDRDRDLANVSIDPLLQGTNGVLTMSFIVTMILCAAGYLIYWIMSIRSRELMFGILRACGMHKEEIFHMLIVEQIFSGAVSVFAGFGIGKIASVMFTSIFQAAYAGADQVLPVKMVTNSGDLAQLYGVTATVMIICLGVLTILVLKMNIAKALKLGEE